MNPEHPIRHQNVFGVAQNDARQHLWKTYFSIKSEKYVWYGFFRKIWKVPISKLPNPPPPPATGSRRQYQNLRSQPGRFFGSRSSTVGSWPLIFSGLLVLKGRAYCRAHSPQLPRARLAASGQSRAATQHDADARQGQCSGCIPPHRLGLLTPESGQTGCSVRRNARRKRSSGCGSGPLRGPQWLL